MILERGIATAYGWDEFDLAKIDVPFLVEPIETILKPVEENERKYEEEQRVSWEKEEMRDNYILNDATIFEGEDEVLNFIQEVMRSISLMSVIARILSAFEHMMKLKEKQTCVELIYRMPLQIFRTWAKRMDGYRIDLINEIKKFHESEYQKNKLSDLVLGYAETLKILRIEIFTVLLDLMNVAMLHSTRENTNDFIDEFHYKEKSAYGVEHLIGLGHRDNATSFCEEAERLFGEDQWLTKFIVAHISRHFIVNSKTISYAEKHKLNVKIFKLDQKSQKPFRKSFQSRMI